MSKIIMLIAIVLSLLACEEIGDGPDYLECYDRSVDCAEQYLDATNGYGRAQYCQCLVPDTTACEDVYPCDLCMSSSASLDIKWLCAAQD